MTTMDPSSFLQSPFAPLTFVVAPALLTNASSSCCRFVAAASFSSCSKGCSNCFALAQSIFNALGRVF